MCEALKDPSDYFSRLGGLHDADVKRLSWDPLEHLLSIEVDDLNANFVDLPEYSGACPGTVTFAKVCRIDLQFDASTSDCVRIYGLRFSRQQDQGYSATVLLSPGGRIDLSCHQVFVKA